MEDQHEQAKIEDKIGSLTKSWISLSVWSANSSSKRTTEILSSSATLGIKITNLDHHNIA